MSGDRGSAGRSAGSLAPAASFALWAVAALTTVFGAERRFAARVGLFRVETLVAGRLVVTAAGGGGGGVDETVAAARDVVTTVGGGGGVRLVVVFAGCRARVLTGSGAGPGDPGGAGSGAGAAARAEPTGTVAAHARTRSSAPRSSSDRPGYVTVPPSVLPPW